MNISCVAFVMVLLAMASGFLMIRTFLNWSVSFCEDGDDDENED